MINAKELRIGNLVEYKITDEFDDRKEWWEVSEIDADDIHWLSKVDVKDEDFRLIPLTEEWLLKFGFVENDTPNNYVKEFEGDNLKYLIVREDNTVICTSEPCMVISMMQIIKTEYVHQLQNLHFALTHRELTVA